MSSNPDSSGESSDNSEPQSAEDEKLKVDQTVNADSSDDINHEDASKKSDDESEKDDSEHSKKNSDEDDKSENKTDQSKSDKSPESSSSNDQDKPKEDESKSDSNPEPNSKSKPSDSNQNVISENNSNPKESEKTNEEKDETPKSESKPKQEDSNSKSKPAPGDTSDDPKDKQDKPKSNEKVQKEGKKDKDKKDKDKDSESEGSQNVDSEGINRFSKSMSVTSSNQDAKHKKHHHKDGDHKHRKHRHHKSSQPRPSNEEEQAKPANNEEQAKPSNEKEQAKPSNEDKQTKVVIENPQNQESESESQEKDKPKLSRYSSAPAINHKLDRYGLIVDKQEENTEDLEIIQKESKKELSREMKWIEMTRHWNKVNPKVLKRRILKGIPDGMRSLAWRLILDPESQDITEFNKRPKIPDLVNEGRDPCCNTIEVDLPRTMPQMAMFHKEDAIDNLRSILIAYSNYDKDLGYTQGMAFYAALLLCYMEHNHSFWCFAHLMKSDNHLLREIFIPPFPGLFNLYKVWDIALKMKFSKVHTKLEKIKLPPEMYVPSWFMCNFLNSGFPMDVKLRLFDAYSYYGTRSTFSFCFTIIRLTQQALLKGTQEEIITLLQRPYESPLLSNWRILLKNFQENFLSSKQYVQFFKKANLPVFP